MLRRCYGTQPRQMSVLRACFCRSMQPPEGGYLSRQKKRKRTTHRRGVFHFRLTPSSQRYNTLDFPRESRVPRKAPPLRFAPVRAKRTSTGRSAPFGYRPPRGCTPLESRSFRESVPDLKTPHFSNQPSFPKTAQAAICLLPRDADRACALHTFTERIPYERFYFK